MEGIEQVTFVAPVLLTIPAVGNAVTVIVIGYVTLTVLVVAFLTVKFAL